LLIYPEDVEMDRWNGMTVKDRERRRIGMKINYNNTNYNNINILLSR